MRRLWLLTHLLALAYYAAVSPAAQRAALPDVSLLRSFTFRSIGPAITGGRVADVEAIENRPSTFYVAASIGGVWKTVNNGTTWEPVFGGAGSAAMGDIAIAPSNSDVIWVGTGESNADHGSWGDGLYKSMDAGKTWTHVGLRDSHHIGRILVDPRNANIVYVAAQGRLWGPNRERGLFKTTDGGQTWTPVLYVDEDTGATDVIMDPAKPDVLIAATYQRRRSPWGTNGGGPGSGLHKSEDGGKTWRQLTAGLPSGTIGRIGLDFCRRQPNVVYARIEHAEGGVFRSRDHGETWQRMNMLNPQAMGFGQIRVDPHDDQRVYLLGVQLYISDDGGATFRNDGAKGVHSDHRSMWINPTDPNHIIDGSDGGVYVSYDRARTWMFLDNLPIAQFYHVGVDMQQPYNVYGGLQDFGSWGAPSRTRNLYGVLNDDWFMIAGADGFFTFVDPTDPTMVYTATQRGRLLRFDPRNGAHKAIQPEIPGEDLTWGIAAPFFLSVHDPATVYGGAHRVLRSPDRGHSWTPISPDLTTGADRAELAVMGVKNSDITLSRDSGGESYGTITALAESTKSPRLLYAGTDDGNLQVTRDGGGSWTNVIAALPGVPKATWVSSLSTSWRDANTAYVTFDGHRSNDFRSYVFMTTDAGSTWKAINSGLPETVALIVREDPRNANLLYLGTEMGLFVSFDRGGRWQRFTSNLPTIPVDDLVVHPRDNDLVLATRGRGIWILDDAAPLQGLAKVIGTNAALFEIRPGTEFRLKSNRVWLGHGVFAGPNPPAGTIISYYLGRGVEGTVTIQIQSGSGEVVRELTGAGTAGLHRLHWDLRWPGPAGVRPDVTGGFWGIGSLGAYVLPGQYRARLIVDGQEAGVQSIRVDRDPLINLTEADHLRYMRSVQALTEMQSGVTSAIGALRALVTALGTMQESLRGNTSVPDTVRSAGAQLQRRIVELQRQLGPPAEAEGPMAPPVVAVMAVRTANAPMQGQPAESVVPLDEQRQPAPGGRGAGAPQARLARPEAAEFLALRRVLRGRIQTLKSEIAASPTAPTAVQHDNVRRVAEEYAGLVDRFNALFTEGLTSFNRLLEDSRLSVLPDVSVKPLVPVKYDHP